MEIATVLVPGTGDARKSGALYDKGFLTTKL